MSEQQSQRPRILSGMRPTGKLHLGHLVGALQNWIPLTEKYESYHFVADWHALTTDYADPSDVRVNTLEMVTDWLAVGLDPTKATFFIQSRLLEHAELHLFFSMVTPLGWLERVPTYKEQLDNIKDRDLHTYGFLGYPVLQAADILLYRADLVPVGEDQVQHLELTREIARRWNQQFAPGDAPYFPAPQAQLTTAKRIVGLDGQAKMSKSLGNTIGLTESPDEIWAKLRPAITDPARVRKTDPGNPERCPVIFELHRHFSPPETVAVVEEKCRSAGWGCLECKRVLADHMVTGLAPIRARAAELTGQPERVAETLALGAERARAIARDTMSAVRERMGFLQAREG